MRILALALLLSLAACAEAAFSLVEPSPLPPGGSQHDDIAYYTGEGFDDEKHRLDLYVPPGDGPFPVVVFVHGGGWRLGDRDGGLGTYEKLGRRLAAEGVLAVVPSYRLAPDHRHPEHVRDVSRAIRWAFDHAGSHGGDTKRVFLMGHSAGAHLVALAACDPRWLREQRLAPTDLAGVIAISGPYDVHRLGRSKLVGGVPMVIPAFGDDPAAWRDASPARHLGEAALPPFLVAVGGADPELLQRDAAAFAEALRRSGARVREVMATWRDHYSIVTELADDGDEVWEAARVFLGEVR